VSNPANTSKQNLQADPSDPKYAESVTIVGNAMTRSREFGSFAIPKRIVPPLLCRYEPGMKYGSHADAAIIQLPNTKIRSDLSCTVFIGDPAAYQTLAFKGAPGEAIVYPSTLLHEVVPVRSGQRLVSITFIGSHVADQHERLQVYELNEIAAIECLRMNPESRVRLDVVRQNLLRKWSNS
jgi:PKHD-type hydroxylase